MISSLRPAHVLRNVVCRRERSRAVRTAAPRRRHHGLSSGASAEGTAEYAKRHPHMPYATVKKTGWTASRIGFGGYRIKNGEPNHATALRRALECGVNVVDSSYHFENGASEELVGTVVKEAVRDGRVKREEIVLMTKAGFLDDEAKSDLSASDYVVLKGGKSAHGIGPAALDYQLAKSLSRLDITTVDLFFINNPERMLHAEGQSYSLSRLQRDLTESFKYLKAQHEKGRIGGFAVCSNALTASASADHIPFERVLLAAVREAEAESAFVAIQGAANMFEPEAVQGGLGSALQRSDIFFFAHRLLNVIDGGKVRTLVADGQEKQNDHGADDQKVLAQATESFEALAKLEMQLMEEFSAEESRRAPVLSRFVWAEVLGDNLNRLSANYFAAKHYVNNNVLPAVRRDLEELQKIAEDLSIEDVVPDTSEVVTERVPGSNRITLLKHQSTEGMERVTEIRYDGGAAGKADNHKTFNVSDWREQYSEAMEKICEHILILAARDAERQNAELNSVLPLMAPQLKSSPTLSGKAVRLALSHPEIGCALVGMRKPEYVIDIVEAARQGGLSRQTLDAVYKCPLL